jgi:uncharacterized membrane protein
VKPERLLAFTDGVMAIIITITVLELPVPRSPTLSALSKDMPILAAYALSFVMIGIYWSNHHHMFQTVRRVDGRVLWANHHLLFWLSLFPLIIRWAGEEGITAYPLAAYGVLMTMAGIAYLILERALIAADPESKVSRAVRGHGKEIASVVLDLVGLAMAFVLPWLSALLYVAVAAIWLVPDRRFAKPAP